MNKDQVLFYYQKSFFETLPENIRDSVVVAGGAIRDKILGVEIKDVDVFVKDLQTEEALMAFLKTNGKEGKVNSQTANYTYNKQWVQIIRAKYGDTNTPHFIDSFDFTICQAEVSSKEFRAGQFFWEDLAQKRLRINKLSFPLNSLERMQKYIKKGYTACNGTLLEIAKGINNMDKSIFTPDEKGDMPSNNALLFYEDGSPRFWGVD